MSQTEQFNVNFMNLTLSARGVKQIIDSNGINSTAFIATHAISSYEEIKFQRFSYLIYGVLFFIICAALKNQGFGYVNIDNLHGIFQIQDHPKEIVDYFQMVIAFVSIYLVFRFFYTRKYTLTIHASSGFYISESDKNFIFFPSAQTFLKKLEDEMEKLTFKTD
jgi:hypothetical protein